MFVEASLRPGLRLARPSAWQARDARRKDLPLKLFLEGIVRPLVCPRRLEVGQPAWVGPVLPALPGHDFVSRKASVADLRHHAIHIGLGEGRSKRRRLHGCEEMRVCRRLTTDWSQSEVDCARVAGLFEFFAARSEALAAHRVDDRPADETSSKTTLSSPTALPPPLYSLF